MTHTPWSQAMHRALYSPDGFYRRQPPSRHFRTSAQSGLFAEAIATLLSRVDAALGHPEPFTLVDMAAGGGELLTALLKRAEFADRMDPIAVEMRPRPASLDPRIAWRAELPDTVHGVVLACEYLDNVPCDVAEVDQTGVTRQQLVDTSGDVTLGEPVSPGDAEWLRQWWPLQDAGDRAEVGWRRDEAWRQLCGRVERGLALTIDYGHTRDTRPDSGTFTGYLDGRQVAPIPDGGRDITAHVAFDSLGDGQLWRQRDALRTLGLSAYRPPREQARTDPAGYVAALSTTGEAATLLHPDGLGAHWWLLRSVDIAEPLG